MAPWPVVDRVVEVIADRGDDPSGRYSYGSGFVVAGSTVLTSAHVVAGAKDVWLRRVDKTELKARLDPAFVGDPAGEKAPDLALVDITDGMVAGGSWGWAGAAERNHPSGGPVGGRSSVPVVRGARAPWDGARPGRRERPDPSSLPRRRRSGLLGLEVTCVEPPARPGGDPNKTQWSRHVGRTGLRRRTSGGGCSRARPAGRGLLHPRSAAHRPGG